ncbi:glutamate--tRNA ligase family protein [Sulfurimonas sp.]|uniref:glutamate--tRNA ligase family protein n=1 Tax=Sulfurimonas sp. TaxID=2022749 RepID=UPI002AB22CEE|nr:glutamate--tRNA ligase family protein [Sulfurimonas sp.]
MLRFAPSPIGDMHIDNLQVALFNYIVSKQKNENLIVRIENTGKNINVNDKEILEILSLFDIEYTQVIYQSENIRYHSAMALQLMHDKKAFSCFCSNQWLEKKEKEAKENKKAYRYDDACRNLPAELVIDNTNPFTIRINRPDESFESDAIDSFVLMNQEKTPTYNFACAVDDMLSDISIVITTQEHISNTSKQNHVRTSLGYEKKIQYVYIPTILDTFSVKWLLEEGYLPSAISNYLISMGTKTPQEIFNVKEAIEWFTIEDISKSPTHFSIELLKQINKEHLKNLDDTEISRYVGFADADIGKLAKVYLKEARTTKELKSKIEPIFATKNIPQEFMESSKVLSQTIKNAPFFEQYSDFKKYIIENSGLKDENLFEPLRYLLTGARNGPDIADVYKYIKNYIGEIIK